MRESYDVVISGMGCSALACAYEAALQGKTVLMISNREDNFTLVQMALLIMLALYCPKNLTT